MNHSDNVTERDRRVIGQIADILRIRGAEDSLRNAEDVLVLAVERLHQRVVRSRAAELDRHMVWRAGLNEVVPEDLPDFFLANFRIHEITPSYLMKPVGNTTTREGRQLTTGKIPSSSPARPAAHGNRRLAPLGTSAASAAL